MKLRQLGLSLVGIGLGSLLLVVSVEPPAAWAANPGPQSSSVGLQATISTAPPTQAASITLPTNGSTFTSIPITVSGLCPTNLLIKIFDNNVFVGSALCSSGSYKLQVDLFNGQNSLIARDYDALDQAGPDSGTITVTFNDAQFLQLGTQVTLSSVYAERGALPNQELDWPIELNGGTAPYALSVDWGDGSASDLLSAATTGTVTLRHTYKAAGVYQVIVKATDKNGEEAFLQLVGQANGAIQSNNNSKSSNTGNTIIESKILWWPIAVLMVLILVSFWIGRHYQLRELQKRLSQNRDNES